MPPGHMLALLRDLPYALRTLTARPGFAAAAIVTLALGIGANVTVFTIVDAMLLRPLPFGERSDRIVTLHTVHPLRPADWGWGESGLPYSDYLDLKAAGTFAALGAYLPRNFTLSGEQDAERIQGGSVTPDLFSVLGVAPMLGRGFVSQDGQPPGFESVVILTHGLWQRRYGQDPAIIGRSIVVNDRARTVIGVMPPNFKFPERDEIYLPLAWHDAPRGARIVDVVGALPMNREHGQIQDEVDALAAGLASAYPDTNRDVGIRVVPFRDAQLSGDVRRLSLTLMIAVACVLLVVCANLANLLLVRGASRQRELAVRAALGASRARLMSAAASESLLLAVAGTAAGVLLAQWALDLLLQSFPEELPYWLRFDIDSRVLVFAVAIAALTTIGTGLLPALRAARPLLAADLKDAGRGNSLGPAAQRLQTGLAVAQVAICVALVVGATLMTRSFLAMQTADLGFDHRPLLSARAYLAGDAYDEAAARAAFFERAVQTVSALPGVTAAAATTSIPGDDGGAPTRIVAGEGAMREHDLGASTVVVTPGIFEALGVPLLEGRTFTAAEAVNEQVDVAVISSALARRLWPRGSALERRLGVRAAEAIRWYRVIGVASDVHYEEIGEATDISAFTVYLPYGHSTPRTMAFLLRGDVPPASLAMAIAPALRALHAGLPVYDVLPMAERRRITTWEQRFFGQTMGVFAGMALLIACVGVYALVSYSVRRRRQEIGVRLALGASPRTIVRLFLWQGGLVAATGLSLGLALALVMAQALSGALWGVDAFDLPLLLGIAATLGAVVITASYWPAHRAARANPVAALRAE